LKQPSRFLTCSALVGLLGAVGLRLTYGEVKASMIDALDAYYLRIGDPESALNFWREAPAEPVFQRQRLCGIAKAHLLQALEAANSGSTFCLLLLAVATLFGVSRFPSLRLV
jgi:hypothetical protein